MAEERPPSESAFRSLRRFLNTVLGIVQSRLELFGIEFQEEKWRLQQMFVWVVVGLFALILTAVVVTATVVFWVEEENRMTALVLFCLGYGSLTAFAFLKARKLVTDKPPFQQSLEELKKDRSWLEKEN
jgi:uncharacterized membrane protein YqjE